MDNTLFSIFICLCVFQGVKVYEIYQRSGEGFKIAIITPFLVAMLW